MKTKLVLSPLILGLQIIPITIISACATNVQTYLNLFNQIESHLNHPVAMRNRQDVLPSQFNRDQIKQLLTPLNQIDQYLINYDLTTISANDGAGYLSINFTLTNGDRLYNKDLRIRGFKTARQVGAETNDQIVANWQSHLNQKFYHRDLDAYVIPTKQTQINAYQGLQQKPSDLINWWKQDLQDQTSLWNYQSEQFKTLQITFNTSKIELLTIDQIELPVLYFQIALRKLNENNQAQDPGRYVKVFIHGFNNENQVIANQPWNQWLQQWYVKINWNLIDFNKAITMQDIAAALLTPTVVNQSQNQLELDPPVGISKWRWTNLQVDQGRQCFSINATVTIKDQQITNQLTFSQPN